jgi:hypothetical protein
MIDAKLGRKNHGLIPTTAIGRGLKPLDVRTNPEPDSTVGENKQKKLFNYASTHTSCLMV